MEFPCCTYDFRAYAKNFPAPVQSNSLLG